MESRTINQSHKIHHIVAVTNEFKECKGGNDSPCYGRWVYLVKVWVPIQESEVKSVKLGQSGQAPYATTVSGEMRPFCDSPSKEVLVVLERQCETSGNPVNLVRIHPRIHWEGPNYQAQKTSEPLSAPETAPIVDDIAITVNVKVDDYREGRQETKMFPECFSHFSSTCADQLEVETVWRCEYELSPSSTHAPIRLHPHG